MDSEARVPRPDERGLVAHVPGAEARPRAIRAAAVEGDPDQCHVETGGRGDVGQPHEGRGLGEAWRGEAVAWLGRIGSGHAVTDYTECCAARGFRSGTAARSARVYGCAGLPKIRSVGPLSQTSPSRMTRTSSATWRT